MLVTPGWSDQNNGALVTYTVRVRTNVSRTITKQMIA